MIAFVILLHVSATPPVYQTYDAHLCSHQGTEDDIMYLPMPYFP